MSDLAEANSRYWDKLADEYQATTRISTTNFHYGPLLPGDMDIELLAELMPGQTCLEVGCGAGQNSIGLARRGCVCTAIDVSQAQIDHGKRLAAEEQVEVAFHRLSMEEMELVNLGEFDLVHSTYALPFTDDPVLVIESMARHLKPGGFLLLTTAHPAFTGDWLQDEYGTWGMFLTDSFDPPADVRHADDDTLILARAYPLGLVHDWLTEAGLLVRRLVEPKPYPIPIMTEEQIAAQVPYDSPAWRENYSAAERHPIVAIFLAQRPLA